MVMIVLSRRGCSEQRGALINELAVLPFLRFGFQSKAINLDQGYLK